MKNKFKYFLLIFFLINSFAIANSEEIKFDDIRFEASKIEYLNQENTIKASGEVRIFLDETTEIFADKFTYFRPKYLLIIEDNVEIKDFKNDIYIKSNKIKYLKNKEILSSDTETNIYFKKDYIFNLTSFTYDRNNSLLLSKTKSEIIDKLENHIQMNEFKFEIINKLIKGKFVNYTDKEKNKGKIKNVIINVSDNSIVGNDFEVNFNNNLFGNALNEPRVKSKSVLIEDKNTTLSKAVFTTCKKNKNKCPPWALQAEEISHDKKEKTMNYKNAWLNIYDVPVVYFPKFFHPDPTVKRQSGFLIPSLSGSKTLGQSFSIPYFNAISENKDLTFSPRIYLDGSVILQNEYRQVNKNNNHLVDTSLLVSSKSSDGSKSHFFLNSNYDLSNSYNIERDLEVKLENVSNDTYLKKYNINSPINRESDLNSKIELIGSTEDLDYTTSIEVNEKLNKNSRDRYEYIFPNFSFTKNLNENYNILGNLEFISSGHSKLYDTNVRENILVNDLKYQSDKKINNNGFVSNFHFLVKNFNSESNNSAVYKSNYDSGLMGLFAYENKFPLIKKNKDNSKELFTPKILFNYSPNKTKDMKIDDRRIDVNNIFTFNRISSADSVEGGESLTLGADYRKRNSSDIEIFGFDLASSFRLRSDPDLPLSTTLGQKTSDVFGKLFFKPSDNFSFDYDFSLNNKMNTFNFHSFTNNFKINNFFNTFEYFERSDVAVNQSYYKNTSGFKLNDTNQIKFETRKNKTTDLTEYYNLIYEYKNDCLTASIEYDKTYYTDADIKPEEKLLFKLTIVPFTSFETTGKVR